MLELLSSLLARERSPGTWGEEDLRYVVQGWLRAKTKSDQVYCYRVRSGVVSLHVGSPTLQQEVRLLEYDLKKEVANKAGYAITSLRLTT